MATILLNRSFLPFLRTTLENATTNIYGIIFLVSYKETRKTDDVKKILDLLALKKAQGIDVKIILNSVIKKGLSLGNNKSTCSFFRNSGITYRLTDSSRVTHIKLWLIDNELVILGSHNLTNNSFHKNRELSLAIKDPVLFKELFDYFDKELNNISNDLL